MDDNQCRVCLGEANDSRLSVFKRVNGVAIEEKLQFIAGLKITRQDNFSKLLCIKCFNDTNTSYAFKSKCLDTDRTLTNLERKFQTKLKERVEEIFQHVDLKGSKVTEIYIDEAVQVHDEHDEEQTSFMEVVVHEQEEEIEDSFQTPTEVYEEIEYLEAEDSNHDLLLQPTLQVEEDSGIFCDFCGPKVSFKTEIGVQKHNWEVHQLGEFNPLICQTCSYKFDREVKEEALARVVQKHMVAHELGKLHSCLICPEVFKFRRNLKEHQNRSHLNSQSLHKCKGCLEEFQTSNDLQSHFLKSNCRDNHERPFKCFICEETFIMGIAKKKHIQNEHQDKAGTDCPLCLRCKIPSAVAFENHYKTHFAKPRFCCSFCGRSFYESDRLQTHIKRAHEDTKLSCNWCIKTFRDKSGIARHILGVHFNQRNHHCHLCSKTFTASYNLKEHVFSVHRQASKFYTCNSCKNDFLYRKQYERHQAVCSGVAEKRRR